jgi:hypothetical protein
MKLYIVTCFVEGCDECGNSYKVIGVFDTELKAKDCYEEHLKVKHLHWANINIEIKELNKAEHLNSAGYC